MRKGEVLAIWVANRCWLCVGLGIGCRVLGAFLGLHSTSIWLTISTCIHQRCSFCKTVVTFPWWLSLFMESSLMLFTLEVLIEYLIFQWEVSCLISPLLCLVYVFQCSLRLFKLLLINHFDRQFFEFLCFKLIVGTCICFLNYAGYVVKFYWALILASCPLLEFPTQLCLKILFVNFHVQAFCAWTIKR